MATLGEYSEVAICNITMAETRGEPLLLIPGLMCTADLYRAQITALDEASQAARACKLRYPYARDACLRAHPWNFAQRRAELAASAVAPAFEYGNAYDLPSDCLFVNDVFEGEGERWVIEGRQILTDMGSPIFIRYTALVTDTAQFDPLFVETLAARVASDIAVQLSESVGRAQSLWQVYQAKLVEARKRDSQEGQSDNLPRGSWLDSRNSGVWDGKSGWPE